MFKLTSSKGARGATEARPGRRHPTAMGVVAAATALTTILSGCSMADSGEVPVNVGYQSRTLNTVNAGTLMRDREAFEDALDRIGDENGTRYRVVWHDFSSGAPLTAAMLGTQVDIGSMGDYPLVVNGSKSSDNDNVATEFVATTGYNLRGSLNQVVTPINSDLTDLTDLRGRQVSTSLGSAGDGMLSTALDRVGVEADEVMIVNQDPSVGAAAIEGGQVDALAQFVPWPQLMIFRGQGRLLYDGGENGVPTFHGVVANRNFTAEHPEVMTAFLEAMQSTNDYIIDNPLEAAIRTSEITGIEPEVAYLYNGPGGMVTYDTTIKQQFSQTLDQVKEFLVERGSVAADFDLENFQNTQYLEELHGAEFADRTASTDNPSQVTGYDEVCDLPVSDPTTASEVWFVGENETRKAATPTCLLRRISDSAIAVRAGYVPDTETGLKLFATAATWVSDPATDSVLPFATERGADGYLADTPSASLVSYEEALRLSGPGN